MKSIVIIDFGAGNILSLVNALNRFKKIKVSVTNSYAGISDADFIILPGVGAFDHAMKELNSIDGLVDSLREQLIVKQKKFLGICLGMQLLADIGNENNITAGLGIIKGTIKLLPQVKERLVIPHMGWNNLNIKKNHLSLFNDKDFYFVHSYFFEPTTRDVIAATAHYGIEFASILEQGNILAAQFHPEKSGSQGLEFLKYFIDN